MARKAKPIILSNSDINGLLELSNLPHDPDLSRRASVILECSKGKSNKDVSALTGMNEADVGRWRKAFIAGGIDALRGKQRGGYHKENAADESFYLHLSELLGQDDKAWTLDELVTELNSTPNIVSAALRRKGVNLQRQRQWIITTHDELVPKTVDVVGLYLSKSEQALVVCCSRKPIKIRQGEFITRNRELSEDFKHYEGDISLANAIRTAAYHVNDVSQLVPVSLREFLDKTIEALPSESDEYEYHLFLHSSERKSYRSRRLKGVYQTWIEEPQKWLDLVQSKIAELSDQDRLHSAPELIDALCLFLDNCKDTTSPLIWRKKESDTTENALFSELVNERYEDSDENGVADDSSPCESPSEKGLFLDEIKVILQKYLAATVDNPDGIGYGFISYAYDQQEVLVQIDGKHNDLPVASEFDFSSVEACAESLTNVEQSIIHIRNAAGVHAAELTVDLLKKTKSFGLTRRTEVESELGRLQIELPIGITRHLRTGERIKCGGLIERVCSHSINSSYRTACDNFNRDYHRKEAGSEISLMSFADIVIKEGTRINVMNNEHTKTILAKYGFNENGKWPTDIPFPDELCNEAMEYIMIEPDNLMKMAGLEPLTDITYDEGQYSEPETGLHIRKSQRRGARYLVADEERESYLKDYVLYINSQVNREPLSMIRHPVSVEKNAQSVVNIFIDGDLVPEQAEHRIAGGKPVSREERTNIKHIDIRIETEDGGRYNITSVEMADAYQRLLAVLLETGLIKRYFHFFIDGEKALKEAIDSYFVHWHYTVFLDNYHIDEKVLSQTSMGIKGRRVPSPWEEPIYYSQKSKIGQIRKQPMTSLSRTYASVIKNAIFYGNVKEAIDYIRHIPEEDIQNKAALDVLVKYLEEREDMLTCYAIRKKAGLKNSSNASELCNELLISARQKVDDRMHWRKEGSAALAAITALYLNRSEQLWFKQRKVEFKLYYTQPTKQRILRKKAI